MDPRPVLKATNLYRFFRTGADEVLALRGVSLQVEPGQIVAVIGPSGSGKSTLLTCLAGLDEPAGGLVVVGGERISHRPETERARIRARRVGVLMQTGNLLGHLDLRANIRIAQLATGARDRTSADDLLDRVDLTARSMAYPPQLSGGELARAALATALANNPDVLLADEPTGELDGQTEQHVLQLLAEHARGGCGLVLVTHSAEVARVADQVITLRDGQIAR